MRSFAATQYQQTKTSWMPLKEGEFHLDKPEVPKCINGVIISEVFTVSKHKGPCYMKYMGDLRFSSTSDETSGFY